MISSPTPHYPSFYLTVLGWEHLQLDQQLPFLYYTVLCDLRKSELIPCSSLVKFMHDMPQWLDASGQVSGEQVPQGHQ